MTDFMQRENRVSNGISVFLLPKGFNSMQLSEFVEGGFPSRPHTSWGGKGFLRETFITSNRKRPSWTSRHIGIKVTNMSVKRLDVKYRARLSLNTNCGFMHSGQHQPKTNEEEKEIARFPFWQKNYWLHTKSNSKHLKQSNGLPTWWSLS